METFSEAKERLHKVVTESDISMELKEAFQTLIDTFFIDNQNLSKRRKQQLKYDFELASS
ncbi:hypothetical protein [Methanococcoides seepicolus]|jgi:hypothetical protein|uniref:Uncharacterized protein n=1 Tax=Methanococcoides seepicolus TaxID=2828780 RepID=A0A9E4ZHG0_9EURY|nr:hypothetical protein [Methanococcoides seepicolus]MCM1987691.1 hypothetical protein [Methanococcoides seepicolus]